MPDVWAAFPDLDAAMQERLAGVLETRGADPQQRKMRETFLADVPFPNDARVLEVGCGTGVTTRAIALRPNVGTVVQGRIASIHELPSPQRAIIEHFVRYPYHAM